MAFTTLCQLKELAPGQTALFEVEGRAVLLVWPSGGELRAFKGLCPHQEISLADATLDAGALMCQVHRWRFDASTGRGIGPHFLCLDQYALRVEAGAVQVDVTAQVLPDLV